MRDGPGTGITGTESVIAALHQAIARIAQQRRAGIRNQRYTFSDSQMIEDRQPPTSAGMVVVGDRLASREAEFRGMLINRRKNAGVLRSQHVRASQNIDGAKSHVSGANRSAWKRRKGRAQDSQRSCRPWGLMLAWVGKML